MEYLSLDLKIALASVFVQVLLSFYAALAMGVARTRAVRDGRMPPEHVALDSNACPEDVRKLGNNLADQFEFPVLLYSAVAFAAIFDAASMPFALACVGYVVTRILHRFIHVNANDVRARFQVYMAGLFLLFLAWVFLAMGLWGQV